MTDALTDNIGVDRAIAPTSRAISMRPIFFILIAAATCFFSAGGLVEAASFRQGVSTVSRRDRDYVSAARILVRRAERGEPAAQTYLGFMFEAGRGVPQNYTEAAMWYRRAAEQGDSLAQYALGLLYDKGQGVPRDIVEASKWLNLSAAAAPPRAREARARIRDAVTRKM